MAALESRSIAPPSDAEDLAARVRRLEDERQILQLIDLHGMLSDAGPAEGFAALYAEDCVVDLGEILKPAAKTVVAGRDRLLEEIYLEPGHRAAEGRTQHFRSGPQIIQVLGDDAEAVTYAMTSLLQADGSARVMVSGFNFWTLRRASERWRITRRTHRRLGDGDVVDLFRPLVARTLAGLG
jgi:SnoaL-like protein